MSLKCKHCQKTMKMGKANRGHLVDAALGQYTRQRSCACGATDMTVELRQNELSELRRKAYLYMMSEALACGGAA